MKALRYVKTWVLHFRWFNDASSRPDLGSSADFRALSEENEIATAIVFRCGFRRETYSGTSRLRPRSSALL